MDMLHSIFKNLFTLLCLAITLVLISDLLVDYVIERPTTTTKIEKELETSDLPNAQCAFCVVRWPFGQKLKSKNTLSDGKKYF